MYESRPHQLSREQDSHPVSTPGPVVMARSWPSLPPGAEDALAPRVPGRPKAHPPSVKTELTTGPSLAVFLVGPSLRWDLRLEPGLP